MVGCQGYALAGLNGLVEPLPGSRMRDRAVIPQARETFSPIGIGRARRSNPHRVFSSVGGSMIDSDQFQIVFHFYMARL